MVFLCACFCVVQCIGLRECCMVYGIELNDSRVVVICVLYSVIVSCSVILFKVHGNSMLNMGLFLLC